jgi:hypothetical protein
MTIHFQYITATKTQNKFKFFINYRKADIVDEDFDERFLDKRSLRTSLIREVSGLS